MKPGRQETRGRDSRVLNRISPSMRKLGFAGEQTREWVHLSKDTPTLICFPCDMNSIQLYLRFPESGGKAPGVDKEGIHSKVLEEVAGHLVHTSVFQVP